MSQRRLCKASCRS